MLIANIRAEILLVCRLGERQRRIERVTETERRFGYDRIRAIGQRGHKCQLRSTLFGVGSVVEE